MKRALISLLLTAGLFALACANPSGQLVPDPALFGKSELGFIRAGETKREEILYRLGHPAARFEDDRILIYQVGFEASGKVHFYAPRLFSGPTPTIADWKPGTFSLVLVFSPDGVLEKLSLVSTE